MIRRVWWMFAAVWAGFSLIWGPLEGPDTVKDRIIHAFVPVILFGVFAPILRALNFRRAYREGGWAGVGGIVFLWVLAFTLFIGPIFAERLGWLGVRDGLLWGLAFMCGMLPALMFCGWLFVALPFKVLRWLARLVFPGLVAATSRHTRLPEP